MPVIFGVDGLQGGLELLSAERAEGVAARQRGDVQGHGSGLLGCEGVGMLRRLARAAAMKPAIYRACRGAYAPPEGPMG